MYTINKYYDAVDQNDWDIKDISIIESCLADIYMSIPESEKEENRIDFKREQETISFNKSPEGIKWQTSWIDENNKETEVWPDINSWDDNDFEYILLRFRNCKNLFLKSEYGLILFYKGKLSSDECKVLFDLLFELAQKYYNANTENDEQPYHSWAFYNALSNALHISNFKRKAPGFTNEFDKALLYAEDIHKRWEKAGLKMLRMTIDMTGLILKYFQYAKLVVDIKGFYDRNILACEEQNKTYTWGAIYIIDENIRICKASKMDVAPMIQKKAELYEKLAIDAEHSDRQLTAIDFIEKALFFYREINDIINISRLEEKYSKIRGGGAFNEYSKQISQEETDRLSEIIEKEINEKDSFGILENIRWCSMYSNLDTIKQEVEDWKKQASAMYHFGSSIVDKLGNTIAKHKGESEEFAFWQIYSLHFQVGTSTLVNYFLHAIKSAKLHSDSVIEYLSNTWLNRPIQRNYNPNQAKIIPLDLVIPSISFFLNEIDIWFKSPENKPNLIVAIDSLVLKAEALLRYFCDIVDIPTFKQREDGIVMEKNLDEILAALEHKPNADPPIITNFREDDRKFIKFVLSEKCGENLRNRIAHGLLDAEEYSIEKAILAFTIIIRLSKYQFKKNEL